jgi:exonuclease SbcD
MRIAHAADTHLGYKALTKIDPATGRNSRSLDVEAAFAQLIEQVIGADVDLFLLAGDVFHTPRPAWQAIAAFVAQMRRLEEAGIPAVVLAGNHDTPRLRASGSVFSVLETALPGTIFATGYEPRDLSLLSELSGERVHLCCLPSGLLSSPKPFRATTSPEGVNLLLTHGLVSDIAGQRGGPEIGEEQVPDQMLLAAYDYIALGDWHAWQKVRPNAWYAGSTERFGWSDRDADPGWLLVELGADGLTVAHQALATRPMVELGPFPVRDLSREQVLASIVQARRLTDRDALCRIVLEGAAPAQRAELGRWLPAQLKEAWWHVSVAFARHGRVSDAERLSELCEYELPSVLELFEEWMVERRAQWSPEFSARFNTQGRAVMEGAVERARAELGAEP